MTTKTTSVNYLKDFSNKLSVFSSCISAKRLGCAALGVASLSLLLTIFFGFGSSRLPVVLIDSEELIKSIEAITEKRAIMNAKAKKILLPIYEKINKSNLVIAKQKDSIKRIAADSTYSKRKKEEEMSELFEKIQEEKKRIEALDIEKSHADDRCNRFEYAMDARVEEIITKHIQFLIKKKKAVMVLYGDPTCVEKSQRERLFATKALVELMIADLHAAVDDWNKKKI